MFDYWISVGLAMFWWRRRWEVRVQRVAGALLTVRLRPFSAAYRFWVDGLVGRRRCRHAATGAGRLTTPPSSCSRWGWQS